MKTIIVDDEPWVVSQFEQDCAFLTDMEVIGKFDDPQEALEFAKTSKVELAFLDVEMPVMNGIELAKKLRGLYPEIIIFFVSAYDKYMADAFKMQADYFIMKPYTRDDIKNAFERALLLSRRLKKQIQIRTFGTFNVFVDDQVIDFQNPPAKELLALLVDRFGSILTLDEALGQLHDAQGQPATPDFCRQTLEELLAILKNAGVENLVIRYPSGVAIQTSAAACDYFQFLNGTPSAIRSFRGEYMNGYAWRTETLASLKRQNGLLASYEGVAVDNLLCACIRCHSNYELTMTYMNEAFLSLVGYTRDEISTKFKNSLTALVADDDVKHFAQEVGRQIATGHTFELEYRLKHKDGNTVWILDRGELIYNDGYPCEFTCMLLDVSARKVNIQNLKRQAELDTLTGLYNRLTFQSLIEEYLRHSAPGAMAAMILLDIDNFKMVNDTYGHPFADTVLTSIANLLKKTFRSSDVVGRIGGDEMAVFMKDLPSRDFAREKVNETVQSIFEQSSRLERRAAVSCSIGVAVFPKDGDDFTTLYTHADMALYQSKENGKGQATFFEDLPPNAAACYNTKENTKIDSERGHSGSSQFVEYMFNQLYESEDLFASIKSLLAIVGEKYDISRVYIFETSEDGEYGVNTFEWCAEGIEPEIGTLQALPSKLLKYYYLRLRETGGLFYCRDITQLMPRERQILEPQGIKSMLHYELRDGSDIFGIVGFDECRTKRYWNGQQVNVLSEMARVIGIFLRKYRLKHGYTLEILQNRG